MFNPQVPQLSIPEEILLGEIKIPVWIGVVWAFSDMAWLPCMAVLFLSDKAGRRELAWPSAPDHMKIQKTVEGHAEANGARLKPVLESVRRCLQKVPN